jgi:hypothetical protein
MVHALKIKYLYVALNIKLTVVNRKDVDVNERERLSNFTNISCLCICNFHTFLLVNSLWVDLKKTCCIEAQM